MAMSRSLGGTSLTTSPPMRISPAETSSSPAIIRSVVLFPQPEGPTRTTNSLSGMSRLILRTASTSSKRFTTLRNATSAIAYPRDPVIPDAERKFAGGVGVAHIGGGNGRGGGQGRGLQQVAPRDSGTGHGILLE